MNTETKCPMCAETILADAKKCKHCGEILDRGIKYERSLKAAPGGGFSPGCAAVLSLVIPGAGQMYRGDIGSGLMWLFFVVFGYLCFFIPGFILHLICIVRAAR
jgi:hypothetical protein